MKNKKRNPLISPGVTDWNQLAVNFIDSIFYTIQYSPLFD